MPRAPSASPNPEAEPAITAKKSLHLPTYFPFATVMESSFSTKTSRLFHIAKSTRKGRPGGSGALSKLEDIEGQEEVALTRKFGDESIRITFSIADLNNINEDADQFDNDPALSDEDAADAAEINVQSGGANTKGAINQGRTKGGNFAVAPEDSVAPSDRAEGSYEEPSSRGEQEPSFPARLNINIEKAGKGVLQMEAVAQDGEIMIENVYYFKKPELADAKTAEQDWSRRNLYTGPPFGNLDEDLQVLLERYLDERGVNTALALWVPEYIDWKEQKEYLRWLSNVKSFVDA
ncbi:MAG: hypothetical protein Q9170_001283 [Blastenia crenularia]